MDLTRYTFDRNADTSHLRVPLFSLEGAHPGPRLVVTGPEDLIRGLSDRFWNVPSLVRMHGALVMRQHDQDPVFDRPDATLSLEGESDVTRAYYLILARMTNLGMISGRGVPLRSVA